jgi:hypothetical protein
MNASEGSERSLAETSLSHSIFFIRKVVYVSYLNTRQN